VIKSLEPIVILKSLTQAGLISACLSLMACGGTGSTSELSRSAIPNEGNNTIYRVSDGGTIQYIYANFDAKAGKEAGYSLDCSNPLGLIKLIKATGFPVELLSSTKILKVDDEKYLELNVKAQPSLACDNPGKTLYKSQLDGKTKYFFADASFSKTKLHMFGCQALVDAMGFKLENATPVDPMFIDQLGLFSVDDKDDVSCLSGTEAGGGLVWMNGQDESLTAVAGQTIFKSFTAQKPDTSMAQLSYNPKGHCDWLLTQVINGSVIVTGQVPANFYQPSSCEVEVVAEKGTFYESKKTLKLNGFELQCPSGFTKIGGSCVRPCDNGRLPGEEWLVDRGLYTCQADGSYGIKTINKFMRDPLSDRAGPENGITGNALCEGKEDCVYIQMASGLRWARKDWKVYNNWWDAAANCESKVYGGYSDWRTPTLEEYKAAFADGMSGLNDPLFLDSYSGWAKDELDANNAYVYNFQNGTMAPTVKGTSMRAVLCVR